MESKIEQLDIYSSFAAPEVHMKSFEIWSMTREDVENVNVVDHFFTFISEQDYSLWKSLAFSGKPISFPYGTLKNILLDSVKCANFECSEGGNFHEMIRRHMISPLTLVDHPNPMRNRGYPDNNWFRSWDAGHEDEHKFGKCLFRSTFHPCNSCIFRNLKCFKYGMAGHIQSVIQLFISLQAMLSFVIVMLLSWAFLMIIYLYSRLGKTV